MSEPKIVIGAGAAGLTAAAVCAEMGGRVLLIEKMERPGRKLRITRQRALQCDQCHL